MAKKFAVFDIDGTLIRWQMFHAIVHNLGKHGYINEQSHTKIRSARMKWKERNTSDSFKIYEKLLVEEYLNTLSNIEYKAYQKIVNEVFNEYKDQLFVYSRDLLEDLKKQGYFLIAISGSHDDIIKMIGKYHGFDVAVGAVFNVYNDKFTGEIDTPVHNKDIVLKKLIIDHGLSTKDSYGIGDSEGDIPILKMVQNPIAFNPSKGLYDEAKLNNWKVVVERKNVIYTLSPTKNGYAIK